MILSFFKLRSLLLILLLPLASYAQTAGLSETEVAFNTKLNQRFGLNVNAGYRLAMTSDLTESWSAMSRHLQAGANISYSVGFYGKLGGGVMYRWNEVFDASEENELRLNQYYSWAKYRNSFRWVQRLRIDERIQPTRTRFRFRYRLSLDVPLQGLSLDTKEFYILASTESLVTVSTPSHPEWDQRLTIGLGNQWLDAMKIQLEAEYRWEDYEQNTDRRLFLRLSCIYSL
ncbi:DUF2490 domain-containing protein [Altibacter sp. HG106]|uniref:DUF2490 domain-containing protein n=1 Tax=Altibacter sp. HG106 TaxID=3023937 RepID=UPI002350F875|nr:DUF2490 domain-containing protein [Altibacter sp. HG106]MDC7995240.1 DUF2490 domain-containing protein [Altibacter sp. HG106]